VTYADYTASGRVLSLLRTSSIEDFIGEVVQHIYANTHIESSGIKLQTTRCR